MLYTKTFLKLRLNNMQKYLNNSEPNEAVL